MASNTKIESIQATEAQGFASAEVFSLAMLKDVFANVTTYFVVLLILCFPCVYLFGGLAYLISDTTLGYFAFCWQYGKMAFTTILLLGISTLFIILITWLLTKLAHSYNTKIARALHRRHPQTYTTLVNDMSLGGVIVLGGSSYLGGFISVLLIGWLELPVIAVLSSLAFLSSCTTVSYLIYTRRDEGFAALHKIKKILMPYVIVCSLLAIAAFLLLNIFGYAYIHMFSELKMLDLDPWGITRAVMEFIARVFHTHPLDYFSVTLIESVFWSIILGFGLVWLLPSILKKDYSGILAICITTATPFIMYAIGTKLQWVATGLQDLLQSVPLPLLIVLTGIIASHIITGIRNHFQLSVECPECKNNMRKSDNYCSECGAENWLAQQ